MAEERATAIKSRITVVESIYHQAPDQEATQVDHRYSFLVDSDEQVYSRRCKAGDSWEPLDLGWVDDCVMVSIRNDEGKFTQVTPTDEERAAVDARVLEVAFASSLVIPGTGEQFTIAPQEALRLTPGDAEQLRIRSQSDAAKFTIHVYPR